MRTKSTVGAAASPPGLGFAAMLNPHHLELFYYVARHGGISRALRQIPYGIQQPAVSGQILQLEETLGVKLFTRTPFRLTPEGDELFRFVRPFFANLDAVEARLRAGSAPTLRIGAAESVLLDHLPAVLKDLRRQQPRLQLELRSGFQPELESWLQERQIDLAVAALESRPSAQSSPFTAGASAAGAAPSAPFPPGRRRGLLGALPARSAAHQPAADRDGQPALPARPAEPAAQVGADDRRQLARNHCAVRTPTAMGWA